MLTHFLQIPLIPWGFEAFIVKVAYMYVQKQKLPIEHTWEEGLSISENNVHLESLLRKSILFFDLEEL